VWPGATHDRSWGFSVRAAVKGSPEQSEKTLRDAFMILDRRITLFLSLPLARLDNSQLRRILMT
jgi:arsenate reductase